MLGNLNGMSTVLIAVVILAAVILPISFAADKRSKAIKSGSIVLAERYNTLSIVGFILAFFVSLGAVILGHLSLAQIKRTNERGWGLAVAALVLGYSGIFSGIIFIVVLIANAMN